VPASDGIGLVSKGPGHRNLIVNDHPGAKALVLPDNGGVERASDTRFPLSGPVLTDFCRRHHIRKLSLFGSVLRDDFGPDSDVDVLVEFDEQHVPGFEFIRIQLELSELLGGRKVDLVTSRALSPFLREKILHSAEKRFGA
jgi:predicted nucleotidyltransferase